MNQKSWSASTIGSCALAISLVGCATDADVGTETQALGLAGSLPPLPARGGTGGTTTGPQDFGIIYGMRGGAGAFVDSVSFAYYVPSQPDNERRTGDTTGVIGPYGGSGGTDSGWILCPTGYAAIGLQGGAGDYVDRLGLICALVSDTTHQSITTPATIGGTSGTSFLDTCSSGGFLSGATIHAGTYVDQIQGLCRDPRAPVAVPNVVGLIRSQADNAISNAGLAPIDYTQNPYHCTAPFYFFVQDQTPPAGTLVEPGTSVTLHEIADC